MADILGRTGGPFADQIELEAREIKSARIEGREPNFSVENMAPLLADENAITGSLATTDPNRLDVNINSSASIDEAIEKLVARKAELETNEPTSFLPGVVDPRALDSSVQVEDKVIREDTPSKNKEDDTPLPKRKKDVFNFVKV